MCPNPPRQTRQPYYGPRPTKVQDLPLHRMIQFVPCFDLLVTFQAHAIAYRVQSQGDSRDHPLPFEPPEREALLFTPKLSASLRTQRPTLYQDA